jgi:hypothetical protein
MDAGDQLNENPRPDLAFRTGQQGLSPMTRRKRQSRWYRFCRGGTITHREIRVDMSGVPRQHTCPDRTGLSYAPRGAVSYGPQSDVEKLAGRKDGLESNVALTIKIFRAFAAIHYGKNHDNIRAHGFCFVNGDHGRAATGGHVIQNDDVLALQLTLRNTFDELHCPVRFCFFANKKAGKRFPFDMAKLSYGADQRNGSHYQATPM